jgi:hypothetical protein
LHDGEFVRIVVTGFAASAVVTVHVQGTVTSATARANRNGALDYSFVVPRLPNGQYVLAFTGAPPGGPRLVSSTVSTSAAADDSNIVAAVPRIGLFPFRIADPGSGVDGRSSSRSGSGTGGLSYTGTDIGGSILLALLLLAVGIVAIILGHRHRLRRH